ncbi:hypothetical protein FOA52_001246 [Chlamydomonas sp. UWO 241]|nr:hypothetical protein FOA52_001246 [Chlamydomonas sp. UWO 241]
MMLQKQSVACSISGARPMVLLRPSAPRTAAFTPATKASESRMVRAAAASTMAAPVEPVKLSSLESDSDAFKLPAGYHWYETMMILNSTLNDEERDKELAKFEAYLNKEDCQSINALVRGRARMAYPIKGDWEGIYVLYTYAAKRQTAKNIQLLLSKPEAGSESKLLRYIQLFKA